MKIFLFFFTFVLLNSCAYFDTEKQNYIALNSLSDKDYLDHLINTCEMFEQSNKNVVVKLSPNSKSYFASTIKEIKSFSPSFFTRNGQIETIVFSSKFPLSFSCPNNKIFLSTSLLSKYARYELSIQSILFPEIIKIEKKLFIKKFYIPTGNINEEHLLKINQIPVAQKLIVNEWIAQIYRLAKKDPFSYLLWLQTVHKNIQDFSYLMGNSNQISIEELEYKKLLTENHGEKIELSDKLSNSGPAFYNLLKEIERSNNETRKL